MNRGFVKGEASRNIETRAVALLDNQNNNACTLSFLQDECHVSNNIHCDGYISLSKQKNDPSDRAVIWVDHNGHVNIKSNNQSVDLSNITQPLGYSKEHNQNAHILDAGLQTSGSGSIQFKKNSAEFGASSLFQYDYGSQTLKVSNIAPVHKNEVLSFKAHNDKAELVNVMQFQPSNNAISSTDIVSTQFVCTLNHSTLDLQGQRIYKCGFLGFEGQNITSYKSSTGSNRGCIYTTTSISANNPFPFDSQGNVIIQPTYQGGSVVIPTTSQQSGFKPTFVVSDKVVKINPSPVDSNQRFVEFDVQNGTKKMNIYGQSNDPNKWAIVHTTNGNLEFQYSRNPDVVDQRFILKNVVNDKVFQVPNYTWCVLDVLGDNATLFRTHLTNHIYIHSSNSQYNFSTSSIRNQFLSEETYTTSRDLVFEFISEENSIAFYLPNSAGFQSIENMTYNHHNSTWVAQSSTFSFHLATNEFIDVLFHNCQFYIQNKLFTYDNLDNDDTYTAYVNSYTGFLAETTGEFHNGSGDTNDMDFISIDGTIPKIQKVSREKSKRIMGVMGRAEKPVSALERVIYNGSIGVSLEIGAQRISVIRSGFVGMWVVIQLDDIKIRYDPGDLLTSHSCGAAIKQVSGEDYSAASEDTIRNCTIGKIIVNVSDQVESTANEYTIEGGSIRLMGVMLLL